MEGKARAASRFAVCVLFERREPLVRSPFFGRFFARFAEPVSKRNVYSRTSQEPAVA
jgi:hypothetical protein